MIGISGPSRRSILQGIVAAAPAMLTHASAKSAISRLPKIDPGNPVDQALIFRKLAYSLDDRVGYWWLQGTRYGLVETKLIPFWQIHIGSAFRVRDLSDGAYEVTRVSASFYTDLKTGEYLRKFVNPLNGKTIEPAYFAPKPRAIKYDISGLMEPTAGRASGGISNGAIGPAWVLGDNVWIQSDHLSDVPPSAPGKRPVRINDLVTYFGSLREVADPAVKMPAAGHAFTDINNWPDWLEMDDQPGDFYSRCYGHKAFAYAEMPEVWRRLVAQEYPEVAKDYSGALPGR